MKAASKKKKKEGKVRKECGEESPHADITHQNNHVVWTT
jgi:hypothetical protein